MVSSSEFFVALQTQLSSKKPFVVYAHPKSKRIMALLQKSDKTYRHKKQKGFVFGSYDRSTRFVIPADDAFALQTGRCGIIDTPRVSNTFVCRPKSGDAYMKLVQHAVDTVKSTCLKKVVLAHRINLSFETVDVPGIFKNLITDYSDQFVYLWFHPDTGIWLGATPELLLRRRKKRLKSVSLAGTVPTIGGIHDNTLPVWSDKEFEEQDIVTRFIISKTIAFSKKVSFSVPKSVRAGNLWHLKTLIKHKLIPKISTKEIIKKLHPTPAICGVPRKIAKRFINTHEAIDRKFYTGYLGEYDMNHRSVLYVNLRCIEILGKEGNIYVGAGITRDSDPRLEWEETQNKAETILKSIK